MAVGCKVSVNAGSKDPKPPPPPPPAAKPAPPPPAPAPKPKRNFGKFKLKKLKVTGDKVELPDPVYFETGTANIKTESHAVLDLVVDYMKQTKKVTKLRVEGHTDTDGDNAANQTLSEGRAMAVAKYLVGKGIECKRLVAVGFGETKLVVNPEKTPDDKAQNRRTEFHNAELNGKAIGGKPIDGGGKIAGDACK
jgi:OOP family OmpA-OmpF porin